jgi:hypothetical protein
MDMFSVIAFTLFVVLSAAGLMAWHVRAWRASARSADDQEEFLYHRRQFRRRMQTSAMLGVLGVGVLVGRLLMNLPLPRVFLLSYWAGVLLLLVWLALLALVDIWATKFYFGRLRDRVRLEQAQLRAVAERRLAERDNGQPPPHERS